MKEEFLHYLWKYSLYDQERLFDNDKNKIIVLNPGDYNKDAGPDFFNARISAGGTIWAGNVEIHTKSSHFDIHGHQNDPAFDNVILHVVAENDKKVFNTKGEEIPTAVLKFDPIYYDKYISLVNNPYIIACQDEINNLDFIPVKHWLNSLVVERLQVKAESILKIFSATGNDWDETFYRVLTRYFGFRVNTEPFEMLATALPFRIIRKHTDDIFQIEALLFGTSGLLDAGLFKDAVSDEYYRNLLKEYIVLSSKYSLQPLHGWLWKFSRLRPSNFPTVRISQLASMLAVSGGLFSRVLEETDVKEIRTLLEVTASGYWDDHFVFGKKSRSYTKHTGTQAADLLIINAVVPVLFAYGQNRDSDIIIERALSFLENISAEDNVIIKECRDAGLLATSSFYSQALIHLRNEYCKKRKCLNCRIGNMIISQGRKLRNKEELMLEP
jgi:hypothetical protein